MSLYTTCWRLRRNEETQDIIWHKELAHMKPPAYLVNTSRGEAIDEAALVAALCARTIAGAALDVFELEPSLPTVDCR